MARENIDYRGLFEKSAEGMLIVAADGDVLDANREAYRVLDRSQNDLLGVGRDWVFSSTDSRVEAAFEELRRTGRFEGELYLRRRGWDSFPAEVAMATFEKGRASVVFRDVAERKRAEGEARQLSEDLEARVARRTARLESMVSRLLEKERMLRDSGERFRITFDQANVGIAHVAPDGRWLRVNERLCDITGYEREELLGVTFQDITHSADLDADLGHMRAVLSGEIQVYAMEKRYIRKDGARIWVCLSVSLVRKPSGGPDYFISVVDDITEHKQAREQLRSLTLREMEVLKLLSRGQSNKQIARSINFSEATVKVHVQRITQKLGVSNRSEAAARATELGLVEV